MRSLGVMPGRHNGVTSPERRRTWGRSLAGGIVLLVSSCTAEIPLPAEPGASAGTPSPAQIAPSAPATRHHGAEAPIGRIETVAEGFESPTDMVQIGGRFLVAERAGTIRYIDIDTPVLDLSDSIGSIEGERGLLGIAVHPNYPTDRRLFVAYTSRANTTVVMSYQLTSDGVPETTSPQSVIEVAQSGIFHYGGHIAFGPDGYLYIGLGDGGAGNGDPLSDGQNSFTLLGAILRLDVSVLSGYRIPPDNPFVVGGGASEVWAYGLRNPWRFSFDRQTGNLWIGDVGETLREEINLAPAGHGGLNFGWARYEGTRCFRANDCSTEGLTMPVAEFDHGDGASAVVGGYVYRGTALPVLVGRYLYGDIYSGEVWAIDSEDPHEAARLAFACQCILSSFAEDRDGELYALGFDDGAIYKLVPREAGAPASRLPFADK